MSFVSLIQKDLQKVLSTASQVSPRKSDVEMFTQTKITVDDKGVTFSSINSSVFFATALTARSLDQVSESFSFLVKTELFANSVSMISDEVVGLDINLEKSTMVVQGAKSKHTLRIDTQTVSDFVAPTKKEGDTKVLVKVNSDELLPAIRAANVSVGNPRTVYDAQFLSICFNLGEAEDKIAVVSTDRYRISQTIISATHEVKNDDDQKLYLIPPKGLNIISSLVDKTEEINLSFENDYLWIEIGSSHLVLRYGEGKYPDYKRILPQSFACSFSVSVNELLAALKQVYVSARANTNNKSILVKVNPESKKLDLSSKTGDGFSSESQADIIDYEGMIDPWEQSFNADYLIDFISNLKTENLLWEANPGRPSILSPENERARQLYLVSGLK